MLLNIFRSTTVGLVVLGLASTSAFAQNAFDGSGDGTIVGNYFVREICITGVSQTGVIGQARSATGVISFGPLGNYSFSGQIMDSTTENRVPSTVSSTGFFAVASNGMLQMQSLLASTPAGPDLLRGGVGIAGPAALVASSTETPNYDMLIAIPVGTGFNQGSLQGLYNFSYLNFVDGHADLVRNSWFTLNSLGNGKAGFVGAVSGSAANIAPNDGHTFTQSGGTVNYTLTDSSGGTLSFPFAPDPRIKLIDGDKKFYISPDGLVVIGGAVDGYDLLVGAAPVTNASSADAFSFYYLAGLEEDGTHIPQGSDLLDTFNGSTSTKPTGLAINHLHSHVLSNAPRDVTYDINYSVAPDGTFQPTGSQYRYVLGARDMVMTGVGTNGQYSMIVGLAQQFSRNSAVFLHPLGIVNSANYAPITNPIAPLEIVLLFGQNLSIGSATGTLPLPIKLNNTQVFINGIPAPLFSVSPNLIELLVPLHISPVYGVSFATFQVVNDTIPSDPVTVDVRQTAPGVYSAGANGIGPIAALHANGVLIDANHPATSHEIVELFLTGLGPVTPGIGDGAPGLPPPHASMADGKPVILVDGVPSPNVPYAGLAPGLTGLFQVNAEIPAGTASGDLSLAVITADGSTVETTISVQATQ